MSTRVWQAKRAFWGAYQRALFKLAKPLKVPEPTDLPPVRSVPFSTAYPRTGGRSVGTGTFNGFATLKSARWYAPQNARLACQTRLMTLPCSATA